MRIDKNKLHIAMANSCVNPFDICEMANIQYQTFRRVSNGNTGKPATIGKIAKALNVPVTAIIEDTAATVDSNK